ncbi:ribosome recycling factor [Truepera radiovictrix]|uniref:Ribosome-recycling factor n=1 Tax=Truepera radiovictrix (strain DSM 17093 / CIP 108686 / LMG 22925 / RQ-24) TaxID=649638 RepID=D7CV62_TRURR|nr:ribosome recycling factor [Truepera radiovictrix]ADI15889.1 ribosome recycling factor [Truepera radiovictrix DSM 17093]WMT58485.1 ribosome recycling factor [Truepera radiovictrix]
MKAVLDEARTRMQKSLEAFENNIAAVRTGRANPAILNRIQVNYYGAQTPLNQLATVSSPDARTLVITPFDKSVAKDIEKAIRESDLGFNPNNRGDSLFISVPPLNDERRRALVKQVKTMAEEARVAVRNVRRDANEELKEMRKENLLTDDELRQGENDVQRLTDEFVGQIDKRVKSKEEDIMAV